MKLQFFHWYSHPQLSGKFRVMGHSDGEYFVEWYTKGGTFQTHDYITDSGPFYFQVYEIAPPKLRRTYGN